MKKTLLLSLLALAQVLTASAQQEVGTFSVVPRLGISIANMTNNDFLYSTNNSSTGLIKSKYKTGLMLGADVEYQFCPTLSVSLGGYYSNQGSRYPNYNDGDEETGEYTGYSDHHIILQYLNVPLMLNWYVGEGFALKAGVQVGLLLDSKQERDETPYTIGKDGTQTHEDTKNVSFSTDYSSTDISIPVGLSYEYMNVVLDARYNIGLSNILNANVANSKNTVFTFSVGYRFKL